MSVLPTLDDFEHFEFNDGRWSRPVYRSGTGPAVIVIHEMPGLHPLCCASVHVSQKQA